jgi:hypothetical protein
MRAVIPEAPFIFSIAALSVTLAGFAGLVAAFRRGAEWNPIDVFRLREIAEFGLGNALLALLVIPLATTTGDETVTLRTCGLLGVLFILGGAVLLIRRQRRLGVPGERGWYVLASIVDLAGIGAGLATILAGSAGFFEWQLLFLLARPMLAFVLVLASLRHD